MRLFRLFAHVMLALTLAVNGVAASAMVAQMQTGGDERIASQPESHCPSQSQAESATDQHAHHEDGAGKACCEDGRCACACVHHGTVAVAGPSQVSSDAPDVMCLPVAVPSRRDVTLSPSLRPPIALIS